MLKKQHEFQQKKRFLQDFPQILRSLEEASFPLQAYLEVGVSKDVKD
jgi:hypothetical protein